TIRIARRHPLGRSIRPWWGGDLERNSAIETEQQKLPLAGPPPAVFDLRQQRYRGMNSMGGGDRAECRERREAWSRRAPAQGDAPHFRPLFSTEEQRSTTCTMQQAGRLLAPECYGVLKEQHFSHLFAESSWCADVSPGSTLTRNAVQA